MEDALVCGHLGREREVVGGLVWRCERRAGWRVRGGTGWVWEWEVVGVGVASEKRGSDWVCGRVG